MQEDCNTQELSWASAPDGAPPMVQIQLIHPCNILRQAVIRYFHLLGGRPERKRSTPDVAQQNTMHAAVIAEG